MKGPLWHLINLVPIAALLFLFAFVWWKILSKTGHRGILSLLIFIPIVNLILLLYLAFSEWPIQRELRHVRAQMGQG